VGVERGDGTEEEPEGRSWSQALVAEGERFVLARDAPNLSAREAIEDDLSDLAVDGRSVRRAAGTEAHGECRQAQQFVGWRASMDLCQEHSRSAGSRSCRRRTSSLAKMRATISIARASASNAAANRSRAA
jgi:hypothetical protein